MKRLTAVLLVLTLCVALTACSTNEGEGTTTTTAGGTITEATTTTTTTVPETPVAGNFNVLTGLNDLAEGSSNRPVAVMVPNDSSVIGYQKGIDKADFYFECETEGGIPRLMVAFSSIDRMPEIFGPVRSARSPFITTARSLGFLYVHAGGSVAAKETLKKNVLDHIDALAGYGTNSTDPNCPQTFWRDKELWDAINIEHSLITSREKLKATINKTSYSSSAVKTQLFTFGTKAGDTVANAVQLNSTPSHRITFKYDSETGLYGKNIGTMDNCKPHESMEGNQIQVSNILVLYGEKYTEASGKHIDFKSASGKGYLISGGTAREIRFSRSNEALTVTELDGSPALFATGKTYMVLADDSLTEKISFK